MRLSPIQRERGFSNCTTSWYRATSYVELAGSGICWDRISGLAACRGSCIPGGWDSHVERQSSWIVVIPLVSRVWGRCSFLGLGSAYLKAALSASGRTPHLVFSLYLVSQFDLRGWAVCPEKVKICRSRRMSGGKGFLIWHSTVQVNWGQEIKVTVVKV